MLLTPRHTPKPLLGDGTLVSMEEAGDKYTAIHMQYVDPLLKANKEARKEIPKSTGHAKWRKIASIPALLLTAHPEWLREPKEMERFLASSEGTPYRTVDNI